MIVSEPRQTPWRLLCSVCLCLAGLLGGEQIANAGQIIEYSTNGGGSWNTLTLIGPIGSPATYFSSGGSGGFSITASVTTNAPGSATLAQLLSSTITLSYLDGGTPGNIMLLFGASGYMSPTAPPTLKMSNGVTGLTTSGSITSVSVSAYVDQNNNLGDGVISSGNTFSTMQALVGANPPATSTSISVLNSPYSMAQVFTISGISSGAQVSFQDTQNVNPAAPEPASMTLLGIGLFGMVGYGWRRRRQQQA